MQNMTGHQWTFLWRPSTKKDWQEGLAYFQGFMGLKNKPPVKTVRLQGCLW